MSSEDDNGSETRGWLLAGHADQGFWCDVSYNVDD